MPTEVNRKEMFLVLLVLGVTIVGFNFPDIFLSKTLHMDDNHRYILGLENNIHGLIAKRNLLRAYVIFPLYKLLSINIIYARLAQTVFFYVPLAFTFYLLIRYYTDLPAYGAFFASVFPCILAGQTQIPSFIDGSYTVQGLLVFFVMLHVSFRFFRKEGFSWLLFAASVGLFAASIEMMDHTVFLVPLVVLLYLFSVPLKKDWRKGLVLTGALLILALLKIIQIRYLPTVPSSVPVDPSWPLFWKRFVLLASQTIPFSHSITGNPFDGMGLWAIYFLFLSSGFACADKQGRILIGLGIIWILCSSIVFLAISPYFAPRMAHIAGFGVSFSFVVSVLSIFKYVKIRHRDAVLIALLTGLALYSGIARINSVERSFRPGNNFHAAAVSVFQNILFPENSQIIIINALGYFTGGWWSYSSGFLKQLTGRPDITGIVGQEQSYYNPFLPNKRFFVPDHRMNGIDLQEPVFIFQVRYGNHYSLLQKEYALQWLDEGWNLYKFNRQYGSIEKVFRGKDYNGLISLMKEIGVAQSDVAFAQGKPSR